jgi:hypothetical protein
MTQVSILQAGEQCMLPSCHDKMMSVAVLLHVSDTGGHAGNDTLMQSQL